MKIVFMGTPEFAATVLSYLAESGNEIGYAVSQPDKAKNRGKKVQPTPVHETADRLGIPCLQPEKLKDNDEFYNTLVEYNPDIMIVAAYGKILPKCYLDIPKYGCVNAHGSILPKYRGSAPVQRAILDGEEITGVTLQQMDVGMDTGDIIAIAETPVGKKNTEELMDELAHISGKLICDILPKFETGDIVRTPQDEAQATYAKMIFKEDGLIDWTKEPEVIERLTRGAYPWPGAYTTLGGESFKIWEAEIIDETTDKAPGTIIRADKVLDIACGGRVLRATSVQAPGKKRMPAGDYLRGAKLEPGTVFGN